MFSPKLYTVKKYPLKFLASHHFELDIDETTDRQFYVNQQDNLLFRQIRLITKDNDTFQKYITFVNCKGFSSHKDILTELVLNGYRFHSAPFTISERSASMTRNQILSFADASIAQELDKRITMDISPEKIVLSKYYAYRGLMLSSCHCLENYFPKIIIVPDYYRTIPDQHIKYARDKETEFTDKNGRKRTWKEKEIAEKTADIKINVFDGSGIHHPSISRQVEKLIGSDTAMSSILWRAPYIKGVTNEMDYETFYKERRITEITDLWGVRHDISQPMIIMTESMYKGKAYFSHYKDRRDWEEYWRRFHKYEHCLGVAKWNYSTKEEPAYTRANYQILQDLDLDYEDFASLATYSMDWIENIIRGDPFHTCCFLGLTPDCAPNWNPYLRAVTKNPEMFKEASIRSYFLSLVKKYRDEFKCGKLWLKGAFKFLVADPIMLMEHIAGLEPVGCLGERECFSFDENGRILGETVIERNPHICKSEHVILNGITNPLLEKYCGHLSNTCIINGKSITPQRLNGADFDGDLVLVIQNEILQKGIDKNAPIVIDIEDKSTVPEEENTLENRVAVILRSINSLIGETSNCATGYHNKMPKTKEQKQKYESYIDLLSIINGKAIDFAKTGVLFPIPRHIAKYGRPLPFFMKYAGPYYAKQKKFSCSRSNLNRLCFEIEKWDKTLRFKKTYHDFDYSIMVDSSLPIPENVFREIEAVYLEFCREMAQLGKDQAMVRNYEKYKEELKDWITPDEAAQFEINWKYYYELYRERCLKICPDERLLANIAVILCYETYPSKNKKFLWCVAAEGILKNIRQVPFKLPYRDDSGTLEYLGKKYSLGHKTDKKEEING